MGGSVPGRAHLALPFAGAPGGALAAILAGLGLMAGAVMKINTKGFTPTVKIPDFKNASIPDLIAVFSGPSNTLKQLAQQELIARGDAASSALLTAMNAGDGTPKLARSEHRRKSHATAMAQPPPTAGPSTSAIVGMDICSIQASAVMTPREPESSLPKEVDIRVT